MEAVDLHQPPVEGGAPALQQAPAEAAKGAARARRDAPWLHWRVDALEQRVDALKERVEILEEIIGALPAGALSERQRIAFASGLRRELLPEDVGAAAAGQPPLAGWRAPWDYRRAQRQEAAALPGLQEQPALAIPSDLVLTSAAAAPRAGLAGFFVEAAAFLASNYVEDNDGLFRFRYQAAHLEWSLLGGGEGDLELIVALREAAEPRGLVAFAAAAPTRLWVGGATAPSSFIDFVCVHKAHRGRRLCPLLYDVLLRRLAARGIARVIKTTGSPLALPIASARYFHMPLAGERLLACSFSSSSVSAVLPPPEPELRDLAPSDAASALALLDRVAERHELGFKFLSPAHLAHVLLPRAGLVHTLVRADERSGAVTDLVSCYFVASTILGECPLKGEPMTAAYMYFFGGTTMTTAALTRSIAAKAREFGADVFNMLAISDLQGVLYDQGVRAELSIGPGDGVLRYFAANVTLEDGGVPAERLFLFPGV